MSNADFIATVAPGAQQGYSIYGVLPSITIAQACIESGWGGSGGAKYDKNLFGIKMPGAKPPGMSIVQGSAATDGGYFRRYQSWGDSIVDHGYFLANNSRYAKIIKNTDYSSVAHILQDVGYAGASTTYASDLISTISANNLTQYDTNTSNASQFISIAEAQLGKPYVYGATGPDSFDCSGLVVYIWNKLGLDIARTTYDQWSMLQRIDSDQLQVGDLLYQHFDSNGPGHVGIYLGNGTVIAAPHTGVNVREYTLAEFGSFSAARDLKMTNLLGSSAGGSGSGLVATGTTIDIPETNFGIISGSEQSGDILYGRRYRVIVSSLDGEKALDVSELKCTFNCIKIILTQPQYSTVVIYNLSPQTENTIINEGCRVVIEAGYEGSQYGVIFDGNVVQSIRNKENGTTYTLTLVAADSDMFLNYSLSAFSMVRGQNSRSIIEACASKAMIPAELGNISSTLSESKLTRGKVVFGLTKDYLRQLAQSENATLYMEDGKINIIKAEDVPNGEIIELSPESGLIGVPVQKDYGVTIKCLLNPKIKINSMVHIDNSLVRNQQYEQGQQIYSLDKDGIYRVVQLTHMGDTRGNDWYTEMETVTQAGKLPAMATDSGQYTW